MANAVLTLRRDFCWALSCAKCGWASGRPEPLGACPKCGAKLEVRRWELRRVPAGAWFLISEGIRILCTNPGHVDLAELYAKGEITLADARAIWRLVVRWDLESRGHDLGDSNSYPRCQEVG